MLILLSVGGWREESRHECDPVMIASIVLVWEDNK